MFDIQQKRGRLEKVMQLIVADNSPLISERVHELVSSLPDFNISAFAQTIKELEKKYIEENPEVVIINSNFLGESGTSVIKKLRDYSPHTKIIVLSDYSDLFYNLKYIEAGANYYLSKVYEFHKLSEILLSLLEESEERHN